MSLYVQIPKQMQFRVWFFGLFEIEGKFVLSYEMWVVQCKDVSIYQYNIVVFYWVIAMKYN